MLLLRSAMFVCVVGFLAQIAAAQGFTSPSFRCECQRVGEVEFEESDYYWNVDDYITCTAVMDYDNQGAQTHIWLKMEVRDSYTDELLDTFTKVDLVGANVTKITSIGAHFEIDSSRLQHNVTFKFSGGKGDQVGQNQSAADSRSMYHGL